MANLEKIFSHHEKFALWKNKKISPFPFSKKYGKIRKAQDTTQENVDKRIFVLVFWENVKMKEIFAKISFLHKFFFSMLAWEMKSIRRLPSSAFSALMWFDDLVSTIFKSERSIWQIAIEQLGQAPISCGLFQWMGYRRLPLW